MAGRRTTPQDDEKRSYGALWLLLSLLLLVGGLWAVADDNVFRRPWKRWQAGFGRLEIARLQEQIAAEQRRLDADPAYQAAAARLATAREQAGSGDGAAEIARLEHELAEARLDDQAKDLNLRFVKSELEELRFKFDDAKHHGRPTEPILETIEQREAARVESQGVYAESQARIAGIEQAIKARRAEVKAAEDALAGLTTKRDEIQQRLETVSLGYFPGPSAEFPFVRADWQPKIPKIQQVVLEEFDRNSYDQPVARVDRCMSCHVAIAKPGFEDQENPWKTHPKRELYLNVHDVGKFGCTPCHRGDGTAVNSEQAAHCNYYEEDGSLHDVHLREELAMFRKEKMQTNCIKCHESVQGLEGAEVAARGEHLFIELGCHGCHLADGYEDLYKQDGVSIIGPSLRRIGAKVDPAWLVAWIENPQGFRPRTRMPNFMLTREQSEKVAAYLLRASREPGEQWAKAHAGRPPAAGDALVAQGRALVATIGCRACHALSPDEVAGQLGANKDIAPNLANIAAKTDAWWMWHWIQAPREWSEVARMPSLRLSEEEASAITAYLATLGAAPPPPDPGLVERLNAPANVAAGLALVRKYGCPGCHDIPGMENESRVGAELSAFGGKVREELFFGDRTDLHETWDEWTFHKIKEPRGYATKWIEQAMPQFHLADEDITALRVFLASRTDKKVPPRYRYGKPHDKELAAGHRVIARYNCTGCHVIEERGGDIRRLYEGRLAQAPPNLRGEGAKVQQPWLFGFLKAPVTIRPWLEVRMPTFGLADHEAHTAVRFFAALDDVRIPFVHIERAALDPSMVEAGDQLASKDYLSCWSCHVRGSQMPEGEPDSWAPNLAMAARRLDPDWILAWLHDPQKLMPGTKMPSFYADPDNPDGPPDILGGDDELQMRALRDYVLSLGLPGVQPAPPTRRAQGGEPLAAAAPAGAGFAITEQP